MRRKLALDDFSLHPRKKIAKFRNKKNRVFSRYFFVASFDNFDFSSLFKLCTLIFVSVRLFSVTTNLGLFGGENSIELN
jgi:hypothetical protein